MFQVIERRHAVVMKKTERKESSSGWTKKESFTHQELLHLMGVYRKNLVK